MHLEDIYISKDSQTDTQRELCACTQANHSSLASSRYFSASLLIVIEQYFPSQIARSQERLARETKTAARRNWLLCYMIGTVTMDIGCMGLCADIFSIEYSRFKQSCNTFKNHGGTTSLPRICSKNCTQLLCSTCSLYTS